MVTSPILAGKRRLLAVAVGAEQSEVLQPVIGAVAVPVIQDQDQRFFPPHSGRAAFVTLVDQKTFLEESPLQMGCPSVGRLLYKDFVQWPA
jgi:hypothetical protein